MNKEFSIPECPKYEPKKFSNTQLRATLKLLKDFGITAVIPDNIETVDQLYAERDRLILAQCNK